MKTIDTRDLYTRLCELETLRDAVTEAREALEDPDSGDAAAYLQEGEDDAKEFERHEAEKPLRDALKAAESDFGDDEQAELDELETLRDEIGESTMRDGEAMIPESDFTAYARELADDTGPIPGFSEWPFNCIDWSEAADELKQDYTLVSYQGEDYFIRA